MSEFWPAILIGGVIGFVVKYLGHSLPESLIGRPNIRRIAALLPVALLSALALVQTFGQAQSLVIDARLPALIAAVIALALRAPFLVVIIVAAGTAAAMRALGWAP
jgi:branched-subunit amino acid transport protein